MVQKLSNLEACVDQTIDRVGKDLVLTTPLGLGKPVQLINAFYQRVAADTELSLHILTALSLERPQAKSPIEARLVDPIIERVLGDYEELAYMVALREGNLPANIKVSEFYFRAGAMNELPSAQQHYICSNYTHAARDLAAFGVNVLVQLVALRESEQSLAISLSCNPDITVAMAELMDRQAQPVMRLAQAHPQLPFMPGDAEVDDDFFDILLCNEACNKTLFAVPNVAVPLQDYATAIHASSLVEDGGTLQIGIGALGDAVAQALILRQHENREYRAIVAALSQQASAVPVGCEPFTVGLYASTEMFVNGMLALIEQGVIKRRVYDQLELQRGLNAGLIGECIDERLLNHARKVGLVPRQLEQASLARLQHWGIVRDSTVLMDAELRIAGASYANDLDAPETRRALLADTAGSRLRNGRILHGGFFLGPTDFYQKLATLEPQLGPAISMTSVMRTNQLLENVELYTAQRQRARFINTGMMVTLTGAVVSDALEDGTEISGVGGQYNFVAMAHELPEARSILCIRSTRGEGGQAKSNVLPSYGHITISRQLRDIIVTEYGIADLRGQSDAEVIKRLLNVSDSRFQPELLKDAIARGKLPDDYVIPQVYRSNNPTALRQALAPLQQRGMLPEYPFGSDLTPLEIDLAASLKRLQSLSRRPAKLVARTARALFMRHSSSAAKPYLERMQLTTIASPKELVMRNLLLQDLAERGLLVAVEQ